MIDKCKNKKCEKHQICNPSTGRCVLKTGKIGKELKGRSSPRRASPRVSPRVSPKRNKCSGVNCPRDKICNPSTGRCVLKSGKIGNKLNGKASPRRASPRASPKRSSNKCSGVNCPRDKICNPSTGRCVLKSGKIGKELKGRASSPRASSPRASSPRASSPRASSPRASSPRASLSGSDRITPIGPGIPDKFIQVAEDCEQNKLWKQGATLGQGAYGEVFVACRSSEPGDCKYVLKQQEDNYEFRQEVRALHDLRKLKNVVYMYAAWTCNGEGYIIMETLEKCRPTYKEVLDVSNKIRAKGWTHIDSHRGNFMCRAGTNEVVAIDFGWAIKESDQTYEKHQWARSFPGITYKEMKVFHDKLLAEHFLDPTDPNRSKILKPILEKYHKTLINLRKKQQIQELKRRRQGKPLTTK